MDRAILHLDIPAFPVAVERVVEPRLRGRPLVAPSSDIYETTFFPRAYDRFCRILTNTRPFLLSGKVEEDYSALTLTVEEARPLESRRRGASPRPAQRVMIG